jgi:osmotically-inducible protein OsmY
MLYKETVIKQVYSAMEREPRINLHGHPVHIELSDDGALTLDGEVKDIAAKKLALELAGASTGIHGVIDRLRVTPSERRGDGAIRDSIRDFFLGEPVFQNCTLRIMHKGQLEPLQEISDNSSGIIVISVEEGVITLDGEVISLSHKRFAGVLAWWTPGCRDVVNGLEVVPPEQDNDDEVADALRLVWEKDPLLLNADQLRASVRNYIVNLEGQVPKEAEKNAAELDAWYLFGVDRVVNRIVVRA